MLNKFRLQLVLRILLLLTTVVQSIIKTLSVHELAELSEALMGLDGLSGEDLSYIQEQMNA